MNLSDYLRTIDSKQAKRYANLKGEPLGIATEGILRHIRTCRKLEIQPDASAIREIIDDAANGADVFNKTNNDESTGFGSTKGKYHRYNT